MKEGVGRLPPPPESSLPLPVSRKPHIHWLLPSSQPWSRTLISASDIFPSWPFFASMTDLSSPCFKDSCDCISYVWKTSHLKDFYFSARFFLPCHSRYCSPWAIKITSGYRLSVWYRLRCNKRVASGGAIICVLVCRSGQSPRPFVQLFGPVFLELCLPPA